MLPVTLYDSKLSPAQSSALGSNNIATTHSSSMPQESLDSLFAEYGLGSSTPAPCKKISVEAEIWMDAYEGGSGSSVSSGVAAGSLKSALHKGKSSAAKVVPAARRVSFSPDIKDTALAIQRGAGSKKTAHKKNFEALSGSNPSQEQIAKAFEAQLANSLWGKQYLNLYIHENSLFFQHCKSIQTIRADFNYVLSGAVEEVVRSKKIDSGIAYIRKSLEDVLWKTFTPDERFPDEKSAYLFNLHHDTAVLHLCFSSIFEILADPSVRDVLDRFFQENLEAELAQKAVC